MKVRKVQRIDCALIKLVIVSVPVVALVGNGFQPLLEQLKIDVDFLGVCWYLDIDKAIALVGGSLQIRGAGIRSLFFNLLFRGRQWKCIPQFVRRWHLQNAENLCQVRNVNVLYQSVECNFVGVGIIH